MSINIESIGEAKIHMPATGNISANVSDPHLNNLLFLILSKLL